MALAKRWIRLAELPAKYIFESFRDYSATLMTLAISAVERLIMYEWDGRHGKNYTLLNTDPLGMWLCSRRWRSWDFEMHGVHVVVGVFSNFRIHQQSFQRTPHWQILTLRGMGGVNGDGRSWGWRRCYVEVSRPSFGYASQTPGNATFRKPYTLEP